MTEGPFVVVANVVRPAGRVTGVTGVTAPEGGRGFTLPGAGFPGVARCDVTPVSRV